MPKRAGRLTLLALVLAGCGGTPQPQLTPIGEVIPTGVSFAGQWQLRDRGEDTDRRIRDAEAGAAEGLEDSVASARRERRERGDRSGRTKDAPSVHVFLETGRNLKITQTGHGLFISFDRAVVEEYRFREHRVVSVGPIEAERVSGWQDGRYVVQTLDQQGALLTETYALENEGAVLVRTIAIVHREQEKLAVRQEFDRLE